jgi:hypothetical protein
VLALKELPGEDATDALALAVTHLRLGLGSERLLMASEALKDRGRAYRALLAKKRRTLNNSPQRP